MAVVAKLCLLHLVALLACTREEGGGVTQPAAGDGASRREAAAEPAKDDDCEDCDDDGAAADDTAEEAEEPPEEAGKSDPSEARFLRELDECERAGATHDPTTIATTLALLDALPQPVTIPCFLAALPRPFEIAATDSELSAQPSGSRTYPRIFIRHASLLVSIVPTGIGSRNVELSELDASGTHSLKGDLVFPLTGPLPPDAPYAHILNDNGNGTLCAACHGGERRAGAGQPVSAFYSLAFRPRDEQLVPLAELAAVAASCGKALDDACRMLRTLFRGEDEPVELVFPDTFTVFRRTL